MTGTGNPPAPWRAKRRSSPVQVRISGIQGNEVAFVSPGPAHDVWRKQLKTALGTTSDAFVDMALHHLERAARMPGDGPSDLAISGALAISGPSLPKTKWKPLWRSRAPARIWSRW